MVTVVILPMHVMYLLYTHLMCIHTNGSHLNFRVISIEYAND